MADSPTDISGRGRGFKLLPFSNQTLFEAAMEVPNEQDCNCLPNSEETSFEAEVFYLNIFIN